MCFSNDTTLKENTNSTIKFSLHKFLQLAKHNLHLCAHQRPENIYMKNAHTEFNERRKNIQAKLLLNHEKRKPSMLSA